MSKIEPLLSPDAFVGLEGLTHLCTGGEAPWLKVCDEVYDRFARLKSAGKEGRAAIYACGEGCREKVGALYRWELISFISLAALPGALSGAPPPCRSLGSFSPAPS